MNNPTLISTKEALEILTFVSYSGLLSGAKGTDALTRYPHGSWSREECLELRQRMLDSGIHLRKGVNGKPIRIRPAIRFSRRVRQCPELADALKV